jgi:kinesin family protein 6/9
MVKQTIQIFCRIKPTKSKTSVFCEFNFFFEISKSFCLQVYEINPVNDGVNLSIIIPKEATEGYINNKREDFRFRLVK